MDARLALSFDIQSRSNDVTTDSRLVNALIEGNEILKRPGFTDQAYKTVAGASMSTGQGQGLFSWNSAIVAAVNGHVYKIDGVVVTELTGSPFSGMSILTPLSYTQTVNDNWLVFHDGSNIYVVNKVNNTIIAPLSGGGVLSASIGIAGGYYPTAPTPITFSNAAGNTAATGHAVIYNNQVSSIIIDTPGIYNVSVPPETPTISIPAPPAGTQATITANWSYDRFRSVTGLVSITVNTGGTGYRLSSVPIITFTGGWAIQPAAYAIANSSGVITSIVVTNHGSYAAPVDISSYLHAYITAPVETTATATANMNNTTAGPYVPGIAYLDGAVYVMTTGISVPTIPAVVTITNPGGVVTLAAHGFVADTQVIFTDVGGTLPTGITSGTIYYVLAANNTTNTFTFSLTLDGAAITVSSAGTGTFYVSATSQTPSVIYGSAMNNPTSWNALNEIQVTGDSDRVTGFVRHLNYLVAFRTTGTQFYYDAGLASPASPLAENKSACLEIGCANGYSIASAEQTILWVGTSNTLGRSVYLLDGLSPVKVSTRFIERYLNACDMTNNNGIFVRSYCLKVSGHTLYILTMKDQNVTFIYDLDEKKWYQWTSQSGDTGVANSGTETFFTATSFTGNTEYISGLFLQDDANGKIYQMSPNYYQDDGALMYFRAVSSNLDNGSKRYKFYRSVEVVGDSGAGTISIRKSDDDYQTWSQYRAVNLFDPRPILYQYGQGRRRAWEVFSSDPVPIRLEALEIDFQLSEQGPG
jgi:hypothetical protein